MREYNFNTTRRVVKYNYQGSTDCNRYNYPTECNFDFFHLAINAKKNPNSNLNRQNCFQQGSGNILLTK